MGFIRVALAIFDTAALASMVVALTGSYVSADVVNTLLYFWVFVFACMYVPIALMSFLDAIGVNKPTKTPPTWRKKALLLLNGAGASMDLGMQ